MPAWFENIAKRQVKSPKVYVRDSGLLHALLGLEGPEAIRSHPKLGASWEGFALEQTIGLLAPREAFFWATHAGAELDLLVLRGQDRLGFEFRWVDAPRLARSMHVALETLGLRRLFVVYPGSKRFDLHDRVEVVPIRGLAGVLE